MGVCMEKVYAYWVQKWCLAQQVIAFRVLHLCNMLVDMMICMRMQLVSPACWLHSRCAFVTCSALVVMPVMHSPRIAL